VVPRSARVAIFRVIRAQGRCPKWLTFGFFMLQIAITGGIACGKSVVGGLFEASGVPVCEADALAHALMRPGEPAYAEVVESFGEGILAPNREIDRRRLGALVFEDPAALCRLNSIVHPLVGRKIREWMDRQPPERKAAAAVVPLLFEAGLARGWSAVVCVVAAETVQRQRLAQRGLSPEQARQRIRAQWPVERKAERADYVLVNDGSMDLLKEQTTRVLNSILRGDHA
jgi:dephospho-CoA kinase